MDVFIGDGVFVAGARPDVAAGFPSFPNANRAGWGYLLLTNVLPPQGAGPGNGTYVLHVDLVDAEGNKVRIADRTITVSNSTATKPFGTIDTPPQGATISGAVYVNFGWMLTPLPKTMPKDGSSITAYIDGVALGNVNYNHFRSDIASVFPGLNNTGDATSGEGAIGFRVIDTTQFADGVHTIGWVGYDDGGIAEGVGSRYFSILNGSSLKAAPVQRRADGRRGGRDRVDGGGDAAGGPLWVTRGTDQVAEVQARRERRRAVHVGALERMEVQFGAASCVAGVAGPVRDGKVEALPIGSALKAAGSTGSRVRRSTATTISSSPSPMHRRGEPGQSHRHHRPGAVAPYWAAAS